MNLIVAADKKWGIGKNGNLLAHLPKDLGRFQRLTTGNIIIMGRKTVESLPNGKLLPDRETWILSRNKDYRCEGAKVFNSVKEVVDYIGDNDIDSNRVFVSGGAVIYDAFLPLVKNAYITKLDKDFEADVTMPNIDELSYMACEYVSETFNRKGLEYRFTTYKRV